MNGEDLLYAGQMLKGAPKKSLLAQKYELPAVYPHSHLLQSIHSSLVGSLAKEGSLLARKISQEGDVSAFSASWSRRGGQRMGKKLRK